MQFQNSRTNQNGSAHLVIIVVVVIALIAAAGALVAAKSLGKHKTVTSQEGIKKLLTDATAGKYDVTCTFNTASSGSSAPISITSGTLYVGKNGKRVDGFINKKASHVVQQADAVYIWSDGSTEGSKLPVTTSSSSQSVSDKLTNNADKYQLACQDVGHLSDSTFSLPSSVKFVDINKQLKTQSSSYGN